MRVELAFSKDFADEDLLEVQEELLEQLSAALRVPAARLLLVQMYAAGQYAILDVLPAAPGAGSGGDTSTKGEAVAAEALEARLLELAEDTGSPLWQGRVSSLLASVRRLGPGDEERVLVSGLSGPGTRRGGKGSPVVMLLASLVGVGLAFGLVGPICYGICKGMFQGSGGGEGGGGGGAGTRTAAAEAAAKEKEGATARADAGASLLAAAEAEEAEAEEEEQADEEAGTATAPPKGPNVSSILLGPGLGLD